MAQVIVPVSDVANVPMDSIIKYAEARPNSSGKGKNVSVHFMRGGEPVRMVIQTPKMWCQFGLDEFVPDDGGPHKHTLRLAFKNLEGNPAMAELHNLLKSIDNQNIEQALANQSTWWPQGGVKSRDILEDRYTHIVKPDPSGKYGDQMRVKLDYKHGQYDGLVFDDSVPVNQVDTSYLEPRTHIIVLLEFGPIWIADKSFGQTIRAIQVKCFKQQSIRSYAIQHTSEMEVEEPSDYQEYAATEEVA